MKKLATTFCLMALGLSSFAQYYFNTYNPAGMNPGGLNTHDEQPLGFTPGYTTVLAANATTLQWSTNQTIPFTFNFNGSPVTQYKVSNSGVLTFTTSATTVPGFTNATLPNASIPDKSVCIWGLQQLAGNDAVGSFTHGTAPNRQHWIEFLSYSAPGASGSQWTYWGIVLEETTNNIYIVDKRTYLTPLTLTLGIQIDGSNAVQIATAPNTPSFVTNGGSAADPTDNVYYEFIQGTRPADDVQLSSTNIGSSAVAGSPVTLTATVQNKGSVNQDTILVHWQEGNGAVNTSSHAGLNLAPLASVNLNHSVNWTPANPGSFANIKVWVSLPAPKVDANSTNDTLSYSVFKNNGLTVPRKVLFEEFTTAVCQFCPDGAVYADNLLNANPNVIGVGVHACFGTDAMTVTEASSICSTLGSNSAPTGMVDRTVYPGDATAAFSRSLWASRANTRSTQGAPVDITITGSYTPGAPTATVTVSSSFVDYPLPGNINVSVIVVEDSVVGPNNSGYNQVNAYNTQAGHPYYQAGNPIVGFVHRHVLRDVQPSTFGDPTVIPSTVAINTPYAKTFVIPISSNWDASQLSVIATVNYAGPGIENYQIINAKEVKLEQISTGVETVSAVSNSVEVVPNPANEMAYVYFSLKNNSNVQMQLFDLSGRLVQEENRGLMAAGKQQLFLNTSNLEDGFYMMTLQIGDERVSRKISVVH